MNKVFFLLLFAAITISCKEDDNNCCTLVDTAITIKYTDQNGENLLSDPEGIHESDIKIYHKIDGQWEEYFEANLDKPKGFSINEIEGENYFVLYPGTEIFGDNYAETKIEFSENDADVVKAQFDLSNGNTICTKVWYDDQLRWEQATKSERSFTVVK